MIIKGANHIKHTMDNGISVFDISITGDAKDVVSVWLNTKENDIRYVADKHAGSNKWFFQDLDAGHILGKEPNEQEQQELAAVAAANAAQNSRIARARRINTVFGCFPWVKAWHNRKIAAENSVRLPGPEVVEFKIRSARDTFKTVQSDKSLIVIDMVDYDKFNVLFKPERPLPPIPA